MPAGTKPITSFFAKTPVKNAANKTAATAVAAARSISSSQPCQPDLDTAPTSSPVASASAVTPGSAGGSGKKRFLSDSARQAILQASESGTDVTAEPSGSAAETVLPVAKRARTDAAGGVADIFAKSATTTQATSGTSSGTKASSREKLRAALSDRPAMAEMLKLEVDTMGEDWLVALQDEFRKSYFTTLKQFVTKEQATKKVFPPAEDIYSWSRYCPLKDVRVVIIGQDPYHDDNQAHGLAFSVRKGMRIPPSLRNIYKEMADQVPGFMIPKDGDLTEWAKHGVLLLNTSLTVRAHEAGSHSGKGWEQLTAAVLKVVTSRLSPTAADGHMPGAHGVCFMAWGAHAQKMCAGVDTKKHLVLKSVHPSPLSASRGFFGNGHFKKANAWLEERYGPGGGIDWAALGASQ